MWGSGSQSRALLHPHHESEGTFSRSLVHSQQSLCGFWGMGWGFGRESGELLKEAFPEERLAEGAGEVS